MASSESIKKAYIDFVLTHDEKPKSVYSFTKKLKITEADFYIQYTIILGNIDSVGQIIDFLPVGLRKNLV